MRRRPAGKQPQAFAVALMNDQAITVVLDFMQAAIAYTRLSKPNKKGRPGIGLEAQQAALAAFAKAEVSI